VNGHLEPQRVLNSRHNNPWYEYSEGVDALNFSVPFFLPHLMASWIIWITYPWVCGYRQDHSDILKQVSMSGEANVCV